MTSLLTASDALPDAVASAQDVVVSSDTSTASLIQITALPPATTSPQAVLPKLPYHPQLNILYLVPLFIALGLVLGAITVVIILKWRESRHRLLRTSTLLPGPPYVPPEHDIEDRLLVHGYPSMEQVSLFAAGTPSKFTIHGSRYIPKRTLAWQTLDATLPPLSQPTYTQTIIPSGDGERFAVVTQDDPFLTTPLMAVQQSPKPLDDLPKIYISPLLPDPASGDKSSHHKANATNLPKPVRRSMFDILKLKSLRPVPSVRKEYTVLAPGDEPAERTPTTQGRWVCSLDITKAATLAGESHLRSVHRSLDGGFYIGDMQDALGLFGSQDGSQGLIDPLVPKHTLRLKDGTLSSPTRSETMRRPRKVTPFSSETPRTPKGSMHSKDQSINSYSGDEIEEEERPDIYTKAPQRRHSRTPQKELSTGGAPRRSSAPDMHASVLPLSPPSLMSPPLEKSLFFTSSSSSNASLANRMNMLAAISPSPLHHADRPSDLSLFPLPSKKKATKKLRTSRPEPPLPYPPYPDLQRTPRERSTSANTKRRVVSPCSPKLKGRSTSGTSRESTTGIRSLGSWSPTSLAIALASSSSSDVLNKVNDIVAQGYTKKRTSMVGGGENVVASLPDSI